MQKNRYVDLHVIQTVPPSCVNRDDTGSPKTAIYGGVMRARVSSQAWKRAIRVMFGELFTDEQIGYRTKKTEMLVAEQIMKEHEEIDSTTAGEQAARILQLLGIKSDAGKKDVLFFISPRQVEALASLAVEYAQQEPKVAKDKKNEKAWKEKAEKAVNQNPSIDILLFGRMSASNALLNYDAAAQVAHAISTHAVSNEFDYYTAVDDCQEEENKGAGYLDTSEFNSSTLYRYATVNIGALATNLEGEELGKAVRGFVEAFVRSMPTGKQNSYANRTLPDMVYVTVRDDQPVNLAAAFERPIPQGTEGYVSRSEEALMTYAARIYEDFVPVPVAQWIVGGGGNDGGEKVSLASLLDHIERVAADYHTDGE